MKETDFNSIFAANLKYYLAQNNMSQVELANRLGVGTTSVYNWCSGLKTPRMDKVDKMCEILSIKRSDLITSGAHSSNPAAIVPTPEEAELLRAYRKSSEEIKTAACAVLGINRKKDSSALSNKIG